MISRLIKNKNTFIKFGMYLKDKVDVSEFIKLKFQFQLGFFIEFLYLEGYYITVDPFNHLVTDEKGIKISESNNIDPDNINTLLKIYKNAIEATFKHIEEPF